MTCRCKTTAEHSARETEYAIGRASYIANERVKELADRTPNPDKFEVDDFLQVGAHLVLKVHYPGCANCSFDSRKIMVFLNREAKDVLRWKRIDPHFREVKAKEAVEREAPGPAARFPGSTQGWNDAIAFAEYKSSNRQ